MPGSSPGSPADRTDANRQSFAPPTDASRGASGAEFVLDGLAVPDELDAVHGLFEQAGQAHPEVDAMDLMLFGTAVIEIANNVVEHGRPLGEVRWRVALSIHDGLIEATLADSGREFTPDLGAAMPGENAESGRGFALAEAVLDEITLDRVDGVNRWHMVRRIAPAQSHP